MATQYDTQIQQLYVAYFNRPADASGLAFWANFMATGGTVAQVSAAFAESLEYQVEYSQSTNAGIVNAVYQNLFGRPAETAGLEFWVKALGDKSITVDNMVEFISRGAQGTDKVAFDSKVVVATAFTNALDTDAEKAGYSGADANKAAKELLAGIKTTANATTAIVPATLDASVAKVVKAATPFTLENGLVALSTAQTAIADFLKGAEIVVDGKAIEDVIQQDIVDNAQRAEEAVALEINVGAYVAGKDANNDGDYTDIGDIVPTLPGLKTALIAEQTTANAAALTKANATLKTATEAVTGVTSLAGAIATATSAEDAAEAALEAWQVDNIAANAALSTFTTRNSTLTVTPGVDADGNVALLVTPKVVTVPPTEPLVVAVLEGGAWEVAAGVDASKYPGLTALVEARNDVATSLENYWVAEDARLDAGLEVAFRDRTDAATAALKLVPFASDDHATIPADTVPTLAQLRAEWNALREEGDSVKLGNFETAVTNIVNAYDADTTTRGAKLELAEAGVETAQDDIDDLAEAVANLNEAKAMVTELKGLNADLKVAQDDFVTAKYLAPTMIDGTKFGTVGSDIFVFDDVAASITGFGRAGNDVLYVGAGYSLSEGKVADGDNAVLEVFFNQKGNNAEIIIETEAYGSDLPAGGGVKVITLTGVNIADLTFEDGIITL